MTIIVIDEYSLYMSGAVQDAGSALQWLDAAFTFRWVNGACQYTGEVPGPAFLRPMIELIEPETDISDPDLAMTIRPSDYRDPDRWWL